MVKTKDELLSIIKERIGDDNSDEAISLIEDVTDTFGDLETKAKDTTEWEKKYRENDEAWRTKYRNRFFSSKPPEKEDDEFEEEKPKKLSYEALFS